MLLRMKRPLLFIQQLNEEVSHRRDELGSMCVWGRGTEDMEYLFQVVSPEGGALKLLPQLGNGLIFFRNGQFDPLVNGLEFSILWIKKRSLNFPVTL